TEKRRAGILFHLAMSRIFEPGQEKSATDWLAKNGLCKDEEAEGICKKITSLFKQKEFSDFFLQQNFSLNEPEIIGQDGKTNRPDRVVFFPEHTSIIDYKTGVEKDDYEDQLTKYQNSIKNLGYSSIKKYIVYVDEERIEELA
ncbi:MAG: hypothetical protein IAF38_06970, partial [Bacteroidia bacterium]|nr:hypothetical protein [Bacteroidia bacterium]